MGLPVVRAFAFCLILILLIVRMGSFTEKILITPIEDALFDEATITDGDKVPHIKYQLIKSKSLFDCDLTQWQIPVRMPMTFDTVLSPSIPGEPPGEWVKEIFIPPEESC